MSGLHLDTVWSKLQKFWPLELSPFPGEEATTVPLCQRRPSQGGGAHLPYQVWWEAQVGATDQLFVWDSRVKEHEHGNDGWSTNP